MPLVTHNDCHPDIESRGGDSEPYAATDGQGKKPCCTVIHLTLDCGFGYASRDIDSLTEASTTARRTLIA